MKVILIMVSLLNLAFSATGPGVIIRGEITQVLNDQKVKVKDSFGQKFLLERKHFPKGFKFESRKKFFLEIPEKEAPKIKFLKR